MRGVVLEHPQLARPGTIVSCTPYGYAVRPSYAENKACGFAAPRRTVVKPVHAGSMLILHNHGTPGCLLPKAGLIISNSLVVEVIIGAQRRPSPEDCGPNDLPDFTYRQ